MTPNDWRPVATPETLANRSRILWQVRTFFHDHGFDEVQTPTISRDTVVDRYIDPIPVETAHLGTATANAECYYLQTSPEFCMKRLLAAGMSAIYQLGPAYRAGERGQFHNPEFTMLEWYRAGASFDESVDFLGALADAVLVSACGLQPTRVISYTEAFLNTVQLDPLECTDVELREFVRGQSLSLGSSWEKQSRDDLLNLVFAERVQPRLGHQQPLIVTHYPSSQAALAQVTPHDPRTAERYELFVQGIELANGYHELLDAGELLARSRTVLEQRRLDGKRDLQVESRLVQAMQAGLPDACGCALGVDRLMMLALHKDSIDQVLPFAIEIA